MAYPFGKPGEFYTGETVEAVRAAGYRYSAAVLFRNVRASDSALEIPRFFVARDSVESLRQKIHGWWDLVACGGTRRAGRPCARVGPRKFGGAISSVIMAGIDTAILAKALLAGADSEVRTPSKWPIRRSWIFRGGLAVADQGLISGSNFLLSVLLARWLSAEQYGAYALGYSLFLLAAGFHQALLIEPMSVGAGGLLGRPPALSWRAHRMAYLRGLGHLGGARRHHINHRPLFPGRCVGAGLGRTRRRRALHSLVLAATKRLVRRICSRRFRGRLPALCAILFSGAGVIYRFNLLLCAERFLPDGVRFARGVRIPGCACQASAAHHRAHG